LVCDNHEIHAEWDDTGPANDMHESKQMVG